MEQIIKIPTHIGFIMDGNGRWAKAHLLPRKMGHRQGLLAMQRMVDECEKLGIKFVTFYAFSTENWSRPQEEIDQLFGMIKKFADEEMEKYIARNFVIRILGDISQLPEETAKALDISMKKSLKNTGMTVNIAINYGGRQEIVRAVNHALQSGIMEVDCDMLSDCMYTAGQPDPDIIVRSSGEKRISNFLLWQSAYSELIFVDKHWPDFDKNILDDIIKEYSTRTRRFGKI